MGYNDIAVANYLVPPLTTVRLHMELLGEEAVRLLRERITSSREVGVKSDRTCEAYCTWQRRQGKIKSEAMY